MRCARVREPGGGIGLGGVGRLGGCSAELVGGGVSLEVALGRLGGRSAELVVGGMRLGEVA